MKNRFNISIAWTLLIACMCSSCTYYEKNTLLDEEYRRICASEGAYWRISSISSNWGFVGDTWFRVPDVDISKHATRHFDTLDELERLLREQCNELQGTTVLIEVAQGIAHFHKAREQFSYEYFPWSSYDDFIDAVSERLFRTCNKIERVVLIHTPSMGNRSLIESRTRN